VKAPEKKQRMVAATPRYLRQIGLLAQKGVEPNDRGFDHKLDEKLKRIRLEDVDALFRDQDDNEMNGS